MAKMSLADLMARNAALEAENARLKVAKPQKPLTCKVSQKGAVSVYGLNSVWPTTLYKGQWERLAKFMPTVLAFCEANIAELHTKDTDKIAA